MRHFVVIGDAHRQVHTQLERVRNAFLHCKPEETAVIILGDVGFNVYQNKSDWKVKHRASKFGYTIYCLRGNHELRCSQVSGMKKMFDEDVQGKVWYEEEFPLIRYFDDAIAEYTINGHKCLTVGGAYSVDKHIRLLHDLFWNPKEQLTEEEMAAGLELARGKHYHFILSHTCPWGLRPTFLFLNQVDQSKVDSRMEWYLEDLSAVCEWDNYLFAHYHGDEIIKPHVQLLYEKPLLLDAIYDYWKMYDEEESPLWKGRITMEDFMNLTGEQKIALLDDAILKGKELSGDIWHYYYGHGYIDEIDNICDMTEAGRWDVPETIIFKYKDKFYSIWYYRGLTEHQENEWEEQTAEEVHKVARTFYVWEAVRND